METARKMHVVQVFRTRTEPYTFAGFNHAQNVQICIVYRDHPSFKKSIICILVATVSKVFFAGSVILLA